MKTSISLTLIMICANLLLSQNTDMAKTIYDFTVNDINGNEVSLKQFEGKKVIIVNTASKCGLTPQYEGLQALYEKYKEQNLEIIGFPANNFMGQEPGTDAEIASFCQKNYGVSFPMMSKIDVVGENQHQLYQYLTMKELNGVADSEVQWNFQKYLISESGKLIKDVSPKTDPLSTEITTWIEGR